MTAGLTFTASRHPDGSTVLGATGEIDMSNAGAFATALAQARREAADQAVVVDLSGVEYLDSAGLAVLFPHVDHIRLVATELLAPLLTVAGLDDLTTVV
ncbi:STAS domain-containing protein [Actinoplanes sp. TFC3]|uniref:STAS domain-containing protein n=1 Tax=Actinoplanes sp. TFC3 TaxID=1710355 RepID=UPI000834981B|nr:STAS domain-containing protein [Actinoplanes sp. TFC3]